MPHTSRPPVKSKAPPLHFDTFGGLEHVLSEVDRYVPLIFKNEDVSFIPTLKTTIRVQAAANKWNMIVLSLSKGMARQEMDIILNHMPDHVGPLVIDATARTPEHEVIYNESLLMTRKERIIRLNSETSDVMVVLYGVHGIDPPMERKLLMKRMHYMGVTLDMMIERDDDIDAGTSEEGFTGTLQKALWHIRNIITENELHHDAAKRASIAPSVFLAMSYVLAAYAMTDDDLFKHSLDSVALQLVELRESAKLDFQPMLAAAAVLQNNLTAKDAAPDRPELAHLLQHNHSAIDQLQNSPSAVNQILNNENVMNNLENTPNAPLLQNNPVIREKVAQELKHHHYDQLGPQLKPY